MRPSNANYHTTNSNDSSTAELADDRSRLTHYSPSESCHDEHQMAAFTQLQNKTGSVECKPRITQCTCKGPCNSKEYPTNLDFISDQTATESSNCRSRLTHCSQSEPSHSKHQIDDLDSVSK